MLIFLFVNLLIKVYINNVNNRTFIMQVGLPIYRGQQHGRKLNFYWFSSFSSFGDLI